MSERRKRKVDRHVVHKKHPPVVSRTSAAGYARGAQGRKDGRNDEALVAILEAEFEGGNTCIDACCLAGITTPTFYKWMREGERATPGTKAHQFWQRMKQADARCVKRNMLLVQKHAGKSWQAAAWVLERKRPEDFNLRQKVELSGNPEAPVQTESTNTNVNINTAPLDVAPELLDKALERIYSVRAAAAKKGIKI